MAIYQTTSDTNPDSPWCWNIDLPTDLGHVFGTCFLRRPAPWNSLRHRNCPLADDQKQWGNHCGKNSIIDKYVPTCVCIYISTCVNVNVYTYIYVCVCVCVCVCLCIYTYLHTLHYITFHSIKLQYSTVHCITLYALHSVALHYITYIVHLKKIYI